MYFLEVTRSYTFTFYLYYIHANGNTILARPGGVGVISIGNGGSCIPGLNVFKHKQKNYLENLLSDNLSKV